jgi:single-strand DNA-binding protein
MINNVTLVGRLTKDPELKFTPNGVANATFTLAVNRSFTNQQGEREADFIQCVAWKKTAENLANFQKKGNQIGVVGRIQTRNYEGQDGKRIYITEVVAENVQFLEPRAANSGDNGQTNTNTGGGNSNAGNGQQRTNNNYTRVDDDPFANNNKTIDISDDDLPF